MDPPGRWGLEPFIHQVGGHSPLFCLDSRTVCKPYEEREHSFYSNLPSCLLPFTPRFLGSMQVSIVEDQRGYISLSGLPPNSYRSLHRLNNSGRPKVDNSYKGCSDLTTGVQMRLKRCGSIEIESLAGESSDQYFTDEKFTEERLYNPWALKCHRDNLKKVGVNLQRDLDTVTSQQYILLENLTSKYRHPCVLDLKLGTRQHGDGVSASKKMSKVAKVANTTSGVLGLRLGGMQMYQVSLGRYICRNKHYGRLLSTEGFKTAVRQFFCNGLLVRTDVIRALLARIAQLQTLLSDLDSFRFFTSSLLVIYDGSSNYHWSPVPRNSFSTSSLMLISGSRQEQQQEEEEKEEGTEGSEVRLRLRHRSMSDNTSLHSNNSRAAGSNQDLVDVRLIDFAHSTHKGLNDSCVHDGPDQGLLFGLNSFVNLLLEIERTAGKNRMP